MAWNFKSMMSMTRCTIMQYIDAIY